MDVNCDYRLKSTSFKRKGYFSLQIQSCLGGNIWLQNCAKFLFRGVFFLKSLLGYILKTSGHACEHIVNLSFTDNLSHKKMNSSRLNSVYTIIVTWGIFSWIDLKCEGFFLNIPNFIVSNKIHWWISCKVNYLIGIMAFWIKISKSWKKDHVTQWNLF